MTARTVSFAVLVMAVLPGRAFGSVTTGSGCAPGTIGTLSVSGQTQGVITDGAPFASFDEPASAQRFETKVSGGPRTTVSIVRTPDLASPKLQRAVVTGERVTKFRVQFGCTGPSRPTYTMGTGTASLTRFQRDTSGHESLVFDVPPLTFSVEPSPNQCHPIVRCVADVNRQAGQTFVTGQLASDASVGILVQRLKLRRVNGGLIPTIRRIGRVPLGSHRKGHLRVLWTLHVNGKRLVRGPCLITLRALDQNGHVIARAKPVVFRIRKG